MPTQPAATAAANPLDPHTMLVNFVAAVVFSIAMTSTMTVWQLALYWGYMKYKKHKEAKAARVVVRAEKLDK